MNRVCPPAFTSRLDLSHLAQSPKPGLYDLLQLLATNQIASTEIAYLDMAILKAWLQAFYSDTTEVEISASTPTMTPQEGQLAELLALLDARNHLATQLKSNVDAFLDAAQPFGVGNMHTYS
ncbi:MAG: hypothetical protein RL748_2882 [Pseudomonadota bacterium]|jgi:hypothetical protein